MVGAVSVPENFRRFAVQPFGLGVVARVFVKGAQVVQVGGVVGMLRADDRPVDVESFPEEGIGVVVSADGDEHLGQIVKSSGNILMKLAKNATTNFENPAIQ